MIQFPNIGNVWSTAQLDKWLGSFRGKIIETRGDGKVVEAILVRSGQEIGGYYGGAKSTYSYDLFESDGAGGWHRNSVGLAEGKRKIKGWGRKMKNPSLEELKKELYSLESLAPYFSEGAISANQYNRMSERARREYHRNIQRRWVVEDAIKELKKSPSQRQEEERRRKDKKLSGRLGQLESHLEMITRLGWDKKRANSKYRKDYDKTLSEMEMIRLELGRNPHFRGKLGTGTRFDNCVKKMSRQPGVYDPEGLCASFGRKKYGGRKMAAMAKRGRENPPSPGRPGYVSSSWNDQKVLSLLRRHGAMYPETLGKKLTTGRRKGPLYAHLDSHRYQITIASLSLGRLRKKGLVEKLPSGKWAARNILDSIAEATRNPQWEPAVSPTGSVKVITWANTAKGPFSSRLYVNYGETAGFANATHKTMAGAKGWAKKTLGEHMRGRNPGLLAMATAAAAGGAVGAYHSDQVMELVGKAGEFTRGALASGRAAVGRARGNPTPRKHILDFLEVAGREDAHAGRRKRTRTQLSKLAGPAMTAKDHKIYSDWFDSFTRSSESNPLFWHMPIPTAPPKIRAFNKLSSSSKATKIGGVKVTPSSARAVIEAFNGMSGEDQGKYAKLSVRKMVQLAPFYSDEFKRRVPNPRRGKWLVYIKSERTPLGVRTGQFGPWEAASLPLTKAEAERQGRIYKSLGTPFKLTPVGAKENPGSYTKAQLTRAIAHTKKMQIKAYPHSGHGEHSWSDKRVELEMELWDRFGGGGKRNPASAAANPTEKQFSYIMHLLRQAGYSARFMNADFKRLGATMRERSGTVENWVDGLTVGEASRVIGLLLEKGGRRNPESSSAALSERFHGVPAHTVTEIHSQEHRHEWLAQLGTLTELVVRTVSSYKATISFRGTGNKEVLLASSEDGKQLFFEGGDQALDLRKLHLDTTKWKRDSMVIGTLEKITYRTRKKMNQMQTIDYYHKAGEDTGKKPLLLYDTLNQGLSLAGGQYVVKAPGIIN